MLFTVTGKHIDITEAIKEHAREKVEKLPKFYDSLTEINVIVDGQPGGQPGSVSVEIIAKAEHSNIFVVTERGDDAYACIDIAAHKMERQLKRKKEKERNNKHIGSESQAKLGE